MRHPFKAKHPPPKKKKRETSLGNDPHGTPMWAAFWSLSCRGVRKNLLAAKFFFRRSSVEDRGTEAISKR